MIDLKAIINSLSKEQQQEFLNYLNKKNKRQDAKNVQLVKLLRDKDLSSKEICIQLYKKDNKVAFHALRKRLFDSLIDFSANTSLRKENSIDIHLIKLIVSSRSFMLKKQFKIGFQILEKAAVIAKEQQLYPILNEIYHTKIQYSYHFPDLNINDLVHEHKQNQKKHQLEESLNIAYAKIRRALSEVTHQQKIIDINTFVTTSLEIENIKISKDLSFKSLYQIIQIINISSAQNYEYWNIEPFLLDSYNIIKNHKSIEKQNYYHIEILYIIANTLFRNRKFIASEKYLKRMHTLMLAHKQQYYTEFVNKFYLLSALNNNYQGDNDNAIIILENVKLTKKTTIIDQLDIKLALIVFYFQKGDVIKANKVITKLYHTDKWYLEKVGIDWLIKKNIVDILLQIDLGNINAVESRILSFKRTYNKHLQKANQNKVITYLKLVETYYKNPESVTTLSFYNKVKTAFQFKNNKKEDLFIISFYAWLKAKMTKQDIYLVTLELLKS
ncbi:hypothetical protein [uncultured Polaribacter sp.]|uniref:hypothetical protein n=1 Tax=uncultured Polaribacter sp. TaxID=174711 RepID=UPI002610A9EA|nr:hypothetical protein [uncultured Polaribacter sp.]